MKNRKSIIPLLEIKYKGNDKRVNIHLKWRNNRNKVITRFVGVIVNNVLYFKDKHNHHQLSNSYGVDKIILFAEMLRYDEILMIRKDNKLWTTRKYFIRNSREYDINNGRDMLYLENSMFNLAIAIRADNWYEETIFGQYDLFSGDIVSPLDKLIYHQIKREKIT